MFNIAILIKKINLFCWENSRKIAIIDTNYQKKKNLNRFVFANLSKASSSGAPAFSLDQLIDSLVTSTLLMKETEEVEGLYKN